MRPTIYLVLFLLFHLARSQRTKKVFAHYLPWYDSSGIREPLRTGWCYNYNGQIDCSDEGIIHYANKPLIGEYSIFDADVVEYHLLLMVAAGIDGLVININTKNTMQTAGSLFILQQMKDMQDRHPSVNVKVIVSYDDGGSLMNTTDIDEQITWVYDNIYNNGEYSNLIFKDETTNAPVLLFWSESNNQRYWDTARSLFSNDVLILIRNAREYKLSDGNFEWVSQFNSGLPKSVTDNWGQQYFEDFQYGMDTQSTVSSVPISSVNTVRMGNVYPGFDDENVAEFWHSFDNRYILRDVDDGETMRLTWEKQIGYSPNKYGPDVVENAWVQLTTWNDWPEGTSIEPSTLDGYGYRALETCRTSIAQFKGVSALGAECLEIPFAIYTARKSGNASLAEQMATNLVQGVCTTPSPSPSTSDSPTSTPVPSESNTISPSPTYSSSPTPSSTTSISATAIPSAPPSNLVSTTPVPKSSAIPSSIESALPGLGTVSPSNSPKVSSSSVPSITPRFSSASLPSNPSKTPKISPSPSISESPTSILSSSISTTPSVSPSPSTSPSPSEVITTLSMVDCIRFGQGLQNNNFVSFRRFSDVVRCVQSRRNRLS